MLNLKLTIAYNGLNYFGWQKQKSKPTIQQTIENAFKKIFNLKKDIQVIGSGRTDRGVHAIEQVASIKLELDTIKDKNYIFKINSILPDDIKIGSVEQVDENFNARFNAKKREYRYVVLLDKSSLPFYKDFSYFYPYKVNWNLLKKCLPYFKGKHDFTTFSNSDENINPKREVYHFSCLRKKRFIVFRIIANAFLQGMVRNIIGTIFQVNRLGQNPDIIEEIFKLKNNRYCADKAPAQGLFLYKVYY